MIAISQLVYKYLINRNPKFKTKTEVIYYGIEKFREDFKKKKGKNLQSEI